MYAVCVEQEEGKRSKKVLGGMRIKHLDWPRNDIQQPFELMWQCAIQEAMVKQGSPVEESRQGGQPGKGNRENQATNRQL